jgi:triphosphatase
MQIVLWRLWYLGAYGNAGADDVLNREIELKLELPAEDFQRLRDAMRASAEGHSQKRLRSVYFDSPDAKLRSERIFLRMRNDGGRDWVQTVKSGEAPKNGLMNVAEFEAKLRKGAPNLARIADKALRQKIKKLLKDDKLSPVFETIIDRSAHVLSKEGCSVELALDNGRVEADGKTLAICEVELELLSGSLHEFLAIARELFADFAIRPGASSKAERGFGLLLSETSPNVPVHGAPVMLTRDETARDAFAAILQSAAEQVIANHRIILETGDVEGVHQMRVGLTKLRSVLRCLKPYCAAPWIAELESDAQTVVRSVSHLRDADVLIADICEPVAGEAGAAGAVPGFQGLLDALKAHRDDIYKEVAENLGKGRWPHLLLSMTLGPHLLEAGDELAKPIEAIAGEVLGRRWKKAKKYGDRLDDLDLEERHDMRKALKKLRYTCEAFHTLYDDAPRFIKRLKKLQDLFGAINDVRMAQRVIDIALERCKGDPAPLAAAGYILGRHEAIVPQVWKSAQREWERLEEVSGFWK